MPLPTLDLASLSVEERLRLIEQVWASIEQSATKGDPEAMQVLSTWSSLDGVTLAELEHEADEAERDPASTIRWETLLAELKQKYG